VAVKAPWLDWAKGEIGVHETPGPAATERITYYDSFTALKATSDEIAWCSAFGCAAMENCGIRSPRSAHARDWFKWGTHLSVPQIGCVAILNRGGSPDPNVIDSPGHVTLVYSLPVEGIFEGLGGNQGDQVKVSRFKTTDVLAWIWPAEERDHV
jgi:uncharacterized protein (TIGR02594 family)